MFVLVPTAPPRVIEEGRMDRREGDLLWDCAAKARNEEGEGDNWRFGKGV